MSKQEKIKKCANKSTNEWFFSNKETNVCREIQKKKSSKNFKVYPCRGRETPLFYNNCYYV